MAGVLSTGRKMTFRSGCYTLSILTTVPQRTIQVNKSDEISNRITPLFRHFKSFSSRDPTPAADYQHLMKSPLPTHHFQYSLPRLPIPELTATCEKYLRAQQPLLSTNDYDRTRVFVEHFLKHDGIVCQNTLIREDGEHSHTSYICKPWFDMYLTDRKPLPINYNPILLFVNNPDKVYNSQLYKAANIVISSLRFYRSLNEGLLEPEVYHMDPAKSNTETFRRFTRLLPRSISWYGAYLFKAFPLDMSQYQNLFNTTRIPELGKDRIKHTPGKKHILVMKGGNFYVFDVLDGDGNVMGPDVILSNLESISRSDEPDAQHPLGLLTTMGRDEWAAARKHLEALSNTEALELIDSSLFCLSLDYQSPGADPVSLVKTFLHADGVNRWFDKSLSLIVTRDGTAGINFEHSWGDGVAVLRYFNDIHTDSTANPWVHPHTRRASSASVKKIEFKLDDRIKSTIAEAGRVYRHTCDALEVRALDYQKFGRQLCKPLNISPDAMMQLSFQMAYDLMTGKQVATYESCSTAAFKHGRTETVRPCTLETQRVCKALRDPDFSKPQVQQMIVECSKVHSALIKQAAMGQGFDRHLFALKLKAEEKGMHPAIFKDAAYQTINHNILSTSTLVSDSLQLGAFGPVVQNGFGIGYSIMKDKLGCIVTNYCGHADGAGFINALQMSLDKLHKILSP